MSKLWIGTVLLVCVPGCYAGDKETRETLKRLEHNRRTWREAFRILVDAAEEMGHQDTLRPLFDAIRQVETGGEPDDGRNATGDDGRSIGPYQIQLRYWLDSRTPGEWQSCRQRFYAERVMVLYWRRHCPIALRNYDYQTLARVHNGGPLGWMNPRTVGYWRKVRAKLPGAILGARH